MGSPRERVKQGAIAFLTYVKDHSDGFVVRAHDTPVTSARGGMSSLLSDVAERVSHIFPTSSKAAGDDPKVAPIYAHALVGMVTFVGQWWMGVRKPPVEEVAAHISPLVWMGLRHLPKRQVIVSNRQNRSTRHPRAGRTRENVRTSTLPCPSGPLIVTALNLICGQLVTYEHTGLPGRVME